MGFLSWVDRHRGGAWPRPLAYHIIPNSYLDNISLRSLILVVYFCSNISSPMYGLLFYQRTWYALPSNGEEHHTLRFDTANSYWCTMLGQNLDIAVLSYTINICKIVDISANISSKTSVSWIHSNTRIIFTTHSIHSHSHPINPLSCPEVTWHDNQNVSAEMIPDKSWGQLQAILRLEHDWLAHHGKTDRSPKEE